MKAKAAARLLNGLLILIYALFNLCRAIRGLYRQIISFTAMPEDAFSLWVKHVFPDEWYIWVGSWVMSALFIAAGIRCVIASFRKRDGRFIIWSGLFGLIGELIPSITYSVYAQRFRPPFPPVFFHLVIVLLGVLLTGKRIRGFEYAPLIGKGLGYLRANAKPTARAIKEALHRKL